jgi:Vitamin K-dependent gamma-carboxylase
MKKVLNNYLNTGALAADWPGFLRISTAAFALIHFLSIQADFDILFSYNGLVKPDILAAMNEGLVPTMVDIHVFAGKIIPGLSYEHVLVFFRSFYMLCLACLGAGIFTRISALFSLLTQLILISSINFYQYGADSFTTILLFYCVIFPAGKSMSLDSRLFRKTKSISASSATLCLRVLQIHLCIVYFIGGFDKIAGDNWRNGEAFWKAVTSHNLFHFADVTFLKNTSFFLIAGWATIIIEMLYPVFINIRKTRNTWLLLTISLHLGIMLFLGLFFFSAVMIIFNLAAYYVPYLKEKKKTFAAPDTSPVMQLPVPA